MTYTLWLQRHPLLCSFALGLAAAVLLVWWRFDTDVEQARARAKNGSLLIETQCGPIEYQEAGTGVPILAIHGSGGGYDRGMAMVAPLLKSGIRVIAMSRFGYLRTPMSVDSSPEAQAEAYVCLLDALGIKLAALMAYSAGAPSAVQMAIHHPDRVSALVLLVPIAYKPGTVASAPWPLPQWIESTLVPDFLLWSALHVAPQQVIKIVLGTPPELLPNNGRPKP